MGNQECVICKKEGLKWLQKWRLFFNIPYRCSVCRSEYNHSMFHDEESIVFRFCYFWLSFITSFINFFSLLFAIVAVALWLMNPMYSILLVFAGFVLLLLMMYMTPVHYIEDKLTNRIIRKKKALAKRKAKQAKDDL